MSGMTTSENTRSMSAPSSIRSSAAPADWTSDTLQPNVSSNLPAASPPSVSSSTTSTRAPWVIACERFSEFGIGSSIDKRLKIEKYTAFADVGQSCTNMQITQAGSVDVKHVTPWDNRCNPGSANVI